MKDRTDRLKKIATEMDTIIKEIGPKLVRISLLREEARSIVKELEDGQAAKP